MNVPMPPSTRRLGPPRGGFGLVLALMIMGLAVMTIVIIAGFLSVESQLARQHQLAQRARLNGVVSLRLALAHLQQEAGPDRRATARADLTQPDDVGTAVRNGLWTGVWRTDRPNQPPSWLVSGADPANPTAQTEPLMGTETLAPALAYPSGYSVPWETDYANRWNERGFIRLVGPGSANEAETPAASDPVGPKPSGWVVRPKLNLSEPEVDGTERRLGAFAYWVGDEGVKARINLEDSRTTLPATDPLARTALRSASTPGLRLLPGAETVDETQASTLTSPRELGLLSGFSADPLAARRLFHDVTTTAAGVLADAANGGLRRDLSLAFELSDADFARTEFSGGTTLAATGGATGLDNLKMMVPANGRMTRLSPVFSRATPEGNLRGPTWWALRDYHRLYKQVGWVGGVPTLQARTYFPNAANLHPEPDDGNPATVRQRNYLYATTYAGDRFTLNPNATDVGVIAEANWKLNPAPIPRPLNSAATPYVERVFLVFNLIKETNRSGGVTVYLSLTPIFVLHNPYNVALTIKPPTGSSALALTFSDWQDWMFRVTRRTYVYMKDNPFVEIQPVAATFTYEKNLGDYYRFADPRAINDADLFRVYVDQISLQPGEHKVFTPASGARSPWSRVVKLANGFNYQGGFSDDNVDWGALWPGFEWYYFNPYYYPPSLGYPPSDSFTFEIIPAGKFTVRTSLACWPGDMLRFPATSSIGTSTDLYPAFELYNRSSEHSVLSFRGIDARAGRPGPLYVGDIVSQVPEKSPSPGVYQPGLIIAALEMSAKTVRENAAVTAGTPPAPAGSFPLFSHSNPMAAMLSADGAGRTAATEGAGFGGSSPSYRLRLTRPTGGMNAWLSLLQSPGGATPLTFGGYSNQADGNLTSIHVDIPLVPPTSLGQYTHANFQVRDQQPLYAIGNSFAHPQVDPAKTYATANGWTEYDSSYLLNAALWDGFFLSGAGPKPAVAPSPAPPTPANPESTAPGPAYSEVKSLATVLDEFAAGSGKLGNPRMRFLGDAPASRSALGDYRRSASSLLNDGAFNVNSTSVEAWAAFLGSAKRLALAKLAASSPASNNNARFPRTTPTGSEPIANGTLGEPTLSNWTGFVNLSDLQLRLLAAAIVRENKARFQVTTRTERDALSPPTSRLFRGLTKASTPYLSLSEFINRFLNPVGANAWTTRCGALQAAIFRADNPPAAGPVVAGLTDRLTNRYASSMMGAAEWPRPTGLTFPFPANVEAMEQGGRNRTHAGMGLPGNLLQVDLLQALGASLATRSDTFTIRAYAEATGADGNPAACLVEAVVQRLPAFVNDLDPAEAAFGDLRPENKLFGRRFKVISLRWLKPHEA
jgi:hypothetical protein